MRKREFASGDLSAKVVLRCPKSIFNALHDIADKERKSLNLTTNEIIQIGLKNHLMYQNESPTPVNG